jgi:CheY-like chemotaxis protein
VRLAPDVVLLDLGMPDVGGIEACAAIRAREPSVRVLILTVSEDELDLRAALRVGRDQRGQSRPAHRKCLGAAARIGDEHAPRDLGGGLVVRRGGAHGGIDAVHDGLEHRQNLWIARRSAIHQKDDRALKG